MSAETTAETHVYPDNFPVGWTLQQAVNNVSEGDSIVIRSGVYYEHLNINKSLTIEGFGRESTAIDGSGNGTTVTVTASQVSISALTIQNGDPCGVLVNETSNVELRHTKINASYQGIKVLNCLDILMTDNEIKDNTYNFGMSDSLSGLPTFNIDTTNKVDGRPIYFWKNHEHDGETIPEGAGYVAVVNSADIRVTGLSLEKNDESVLLSLTTSSTIENLGISDSRKGVILRNSSGNLIASNNIHGNEVGLTLSFSDNNWIENNTVCANHVAGFEIAFSSNNSISDNNICSNNPDLVQGAAPALDLFHSNRNLVYRNTIAQNGFAGVSVNNSDNNTLVGNTLGKNGRTMGGVDSGFEIVIVGSDNNTFYRNNITPYSKVVTSQTGPIYVHDSYDNSWNTTYEGNYWSAYVGGDFNGDGIGDFPYYIPMDPSPTQFDHHPLKVPWQITRIFRIARGFRITSNILATTNSTVANGIADPQTRDMVNFNRTSIELKFVITATENEAIMIEIERSWFDGPFEIQLDGVPILTDPENVMQNATHTVISQSYEAGAHTIQIKGTKLTLVAGDLDNDGDVDIFDIVIAASNYGYP